MNMITKSINERSRLEAQAYNTLVDYKYFKQYPKNFQARVRIINGVSEYRRLRTCFDNYQDIKTLKRDKQIKNIVRDLSHF